MFNCHIEKISPHLQDVCDSASFVAPRLLPYPTFFFPIWSLNGSEKTRLYDVSIDVVDSNSFSYFEWKECV